MNTKTKRLLFSAGAAAVALALAIGGTFAYTLREHKSNPFTNAAKYQAHLVEDFDPDPTWETDVDIKKEISVKNMGGEKGFTQKHWGNIYVRVLLKEFLQIATVEYTYYMGTGDDPIRFMIDKNGDFIRFPATVDLQDSIDNFDWSLVITDEAKRDDFVAALDVSRFVRLSGLYDCDADGNDEEYWYLPTRAGDPNGQYGSWVVMTKTTGSPQVIVGTELAETEAEECGYPVHKWGAADPSSCDFDSHDYVQWNLNSGAIIMLDEWTAQGKPAVAKWILDPETGYATWGQALPPKPDNNVTELLLLSITPKTVPDGELTYIIHVDMEATNESDMGDDWVIKNTTAKPAVRFAKTAVSKDIGLGSVESPAIKNLTGNDSVVSWASDDTSVATVDENGKVTLIAEGTATITAVVQHSDGRPDSVITYELTVTKQPQSIETIDINTDNPAVYDDQKGFETEHDLSNSDANYAFNVFIDLDYVEVYNAASIPLEKILKSGDYAGYSIVALDSRFADNNKDGDPIFSIGDDARNSNKPSIFFNWYPTTKAELNEIFTWNGTLTMGGQAASIDGGTPIITTTVKLTKGEGDTKIESEPFLVTIHYTQSVFAYD